jgi:hypothetical protein
MRVTFDTNVWNRMVLPERWPSVANYAALVSIKDALRTGKIEGYICESFATTEAIRKGERAKFHADKKPIINIQNQPIGPGLRCMSIQIETDHSLHPGLTKEFEEELDEAVAIGMKLLSTPYMNHPIPDRLRNNPQIYAPEVFATADYSERFGDVVGTIVARGVGEGALVTLGKEINAAFVAAHRKVEIGDRELVKRIYDAVSAAGDKKNKEEIEKVFAESADGDLVAAHIAFGNDYICSEDRGKSAIGASIFDDKNRAWLKATYGVEILNAGELAAQLDARFLDSR